MCFPIIHEFTTHYCMTTHSGSETQHFPCTHKVIGLKAGPKKGIHFAPPPNRGKHRALCFTMAWCHGAGWAGLTQPNSCQSSRRWIYPPGEHPCWFQPRGSGRNPEEWNVPLGPGECQPGWHEAFRAGSVPRPVHLPQWPINRVWIIVTLSWISSVHTASPLRSLRQLRNGFQWLFGVALCTPRGQESVTPWPRSQTWASQGLVRRKSEEKHWTLFVLCSHVTRGRAHTRHLALCLWWTCSPL